MAEAENIALYQRLIDEGVSAGHLEVLDEVLAPDMAVPSIAAFADPTVDGLKKVNEGFRAGFPDARAEIEEIVAGGDWVAARLKWTGTHTGEFIGLAPTGKTFSISEFEIVRCENGRIVDLYNVFDIGSLMAQLSG